MLFAHLLSDVWHFEHSNGSGCAPVVNATAKGAGSGFVYNAPNAAAAAAAVFEVVSESFDLDKKNSVQFSAS